MTGGRTSPHYGFQVARSMVPCVEVTQAAHGPASAVVAKRVYGFTVAHAISRAQTWMRKHGDPR